MEVIKREKVTLTFEDVAALEGSPGSAPLAIFTLPGVCMVHGVIMHASTVFENVNGDVIASVGIPGGSESEFADPANVSAGNWYYKAFYFIPADPYPADTVITAYLTNTDIADTTAGVLDIWIYYSIIE